MSPPDEPRCYAVRRVNPFLGVLQVIETEYGRAISGDGVGWEIELRAEQLPDWGVLNRGKQGVAFLRYARWTEAEGLTRRIVPPHIDPEYLEQQGRGLVDYIAARLGKLPFILQDCRELWLFDAQEHEPLALLAATRPGGTPPRPEPRYWSAGPGAGGLPGQARFPAMAALQEQVKRRAGFNVDKRWVTRTPDGDGILDREGGSVSADRFPVFLLREDWDSPDAARVVEDYLAWTAPALLTLQAVPDSDRTRLESRLGVQAVSVEHHWRLYPRMIKPDLLRAARVSAQMQQARAPEPHAS